jgi:hypothetical protein
VSSADFQVWVFSTDVIVTGTEIDGKREMIKVFYKEMDQLVIGDEFDVVDVGDEDVIGQIRGELLEMEECILEKSKMGIWNVGYLRRGGIKLI